jgi:isocitrate dehydrogenase
MKSSYNGNAVPTDGKPIGYSGGELQVPDSPIVPFIEGDGTGRDIWKASRRVFDAAVEQAYGGKRRVAWRYAACWCSTGNPAVPCLPWTPRS